VREGVGSSIQNALGSTLMTIANMSVITAEVKVRFETDIVNVHLGQRSGSHRSMRFPKKIFHGTVSEIGDNAIVRSSGYDFAERDGHARKIKISSPW